MKKVLFSIMILASGSLLAGKPVDSIALKVASYKSVKLTTDLSGISQEEIEGIKLLIRASEMIDIIFRTQAYAGNVAADTIRTPSVEKFININYGPWDRLDDNKPFVKGVGPKPLGANFYPVDMRRSEYDSLNDPSKSSPYTIIVREDGKLKVLPYPEAYRDRLNEAANLLKIASNMFKDSLFKIYLNKRAEALISNEYDASDRLWLDLKDNRFDIIIGPIETYEDKLFGNKASYEAYVLVKDMEWSKKLEKYVAYLPELQKGLPVDEKYKEEIAGSSSQLNAYDVIYYAGDCNAGSKTIAVNLPNDEKIQTEKGTRRSQLKNVIKAKFDYIMMPIANELVAPDQRKHVTFNAFFSNTMFHEVAHGLGVKNTVNGKGTVQSALGSYYSALEEGKADILGLYMITQLYDKKVLQEGELMDYYVTFMAGIFRSVRFGASSAHGQANMIRFNYFMEQGAFIRDDKSGYYRVDMEKMKKAMTSLSAIILKLQGDGDLEGVKKLVSEKGMIKEQLQNDLNKLKNKNIPVDVVFEQGVEALDIHKPAMMQNPTDGMKHTEPKK
ncbi:MAG TPA: Zn-dependent hydrolase [Bacteroidia bacterium]